MKSAFITLAGVLFLSGAMTAAEETARVQVKDATIEFTARTIEAKKRDPVYGYAVHEETLYRALSSPPSRILTVGSITIGGDRITLDVSGIGDPWVDARIEKRFVHLRRHDSSSKPVYTLDVCFAKGGADDFVVTWVISGGKSLRTRIRPLGDECPEWLSAPE